MAASARCATGPTLLAQRPKPPSTNCAATGTRMSTARYTPGTIGEKRARNAIYNNIIEANFPLKDIRDSYPAFDPR
jgi:hypothetical protein